MSSVSPPSACTGVLKPVLDNKVVISLGTGAGAAVYIGYSSSGQVAQRAVNGVLGGAISAAVVFGGLAFISCGVCAGNSSALGFLGCTVAGIGNEVGGWAATAVEGLADDLAPGTGKKLNDYFSDLGDGDSGTGFICAAVMPCAIAKNYELHKKLVDQAATAGWSGLQQNLSSVFDPTEW